MERKGRSRTALSCGVRRRVAGVTSSAFRVRLREQHHSLSDLRIERQDVLALRRGLQPLGLAINMLPQPRDRLAASAMAVMKRSRVDKLAECPECVIRLAAGVD